MPELPEVETIKRQLAKTIVGKTITAIRVSDGFVVKQPTLANFKKSFHQVIIQRIHRRGKALLIELSNGTSLMVHLRMTGQLVYPGNATKSRVTFLFSDRTQLDYNDQRKLGELRLIDDWRKLSFIQRLGPEPYELTQKEFSSMLAHKHSPIKTLLMDQAFIAGIGNLYAAEVLFRARIHPLRKASQLSAKEKARLFLAVRAILEKAIKCQGSSIDDYVNAKGKKGTYTRYHKVYGRQGDPCFCCQAPIQRISQGGRSTYFCQQCQQ